ncbi:MAG: type II secretion system protein [Clostridiales bacterium]|nr:type II secretion system protein [Clostridiales bacterium]
MRRRRTKSGFTLIEVLVAAVIFLLILFPFLSTYVISNKINQNAFYIKKATDVVKNAQDDICTWDEDILDVLSRRTSDDKTREWRYLDTQDNESMYESFRNMLDKKEPLSINGKRFGDGMDIYFTVEKDGVYNYVESAVLDKEGYKVDNTDDIRSGYDLYIRVGKNLDDLDPYKNIIQIYQNSTNNSKDGVVSYSTNNDGRGFYLKVTLNNDGTSNYTLREIPSEYKPLEKSETDDNIFFGGKKWLKVFRAMPGDVALMYAPDERVQYIQFPFDVEGKSLYKREDQSKTWGNLASYLNSTFYNSLAYSTTTKYYTSKSWIKKHKWCIGPEENEAGIVTKENVGLLRRSEVERIKSNVKTYLERSCDNETYTLTPTYEDGGSIYTVGGIVMSPKTELNIFPVIYLDKDLYLKDDGRLFDGTREELKNGNIVRPNNGDDSVLCGNNVRVMIYFDKDLEETNLEGKYFEKLRLLVDVVDNRSVTTDDGLIVYTVNNKKRDNYNWLNITDATRVFDKATNTARFKVLENIDVNYDSNKDTTKDDYSTNWTKNKDVVIKKAFKVKGYKINVWAEYMSTDSYRYDNKFKDKHEELELYINKEKDNPTFDYSKDSGSSFKETDNIIDIDAWVRDSELRDVDGEEDLTEEGYVTKYYRVN